MTGTGKDGRITKDDVMAFLEKGTKKEAVVEKPKEAKPEKKEKKAVSAPAAK